MTLKAHTDWAARQYLIYALEAAKGDVTAAARIAGVHRTSMYLLFKRHGIDQRASPAELRAIPAPSPSPGNE